MSIVKHCSLKYIYLSGWPVSEESLHEAAELSGVLQEGNDFLPPEVREECERIIPEVDNVKPRDAADTCLFFKAHYHDYAALNSRNALFPSSGGVP